MYGKRHSEETMRSRKKKYINGVSIYDLNNNLVKSFDYDADITSYLNMYKVIVSKYLNRNLVYDNKYYFKINPVVGFADPSDKASS